MEIVKHLSFVQLIRFKLLFSSINRKVKGWISEKEAKLLYCAAAFGQGQGDIVEIGSAWGKSTIILAQASREFRGDTVFAVDPHTGGKSYLASIKKETIDTYPEFLENIRKCGVEGLVKPIVRKSEEASGEWSGRPIRLLFIDGWHSYECVKKDILNWSRFLIHKGIIILDDYTNDFLDYKRAIDELLIPPLFEKERHQVGKMICAIKN